MLARHLDCIGVTVFAGCLNAEGDGARTLREEGSARMHVVQMDVTKYDQIQECVQYVKKNIGNGGESPNDILKLKNFKTESS